MIKTKLSEVKLPTDLKTVEQKDGAAFPAYTILSTHSVEKDTLAHITSSSVTFKDSNESFGLPRVTISHQPSHLRRYSLQTQGYMIDSTHSDVKKLSLPVFSKSTVFEESPINGSLFNDDTSNIPRKLSFLPALKKRRSSVLKDQKYAPTISDQSMKSRLDSGSTNSSSPLPCRLSLQPQDAHSVENVSLSVPHIRAESGRTSRLRAIESDIGGESAGDDSDSSYLSLRLSSSLRFKSLQKDHKKLVEDAIGVVEHVMKSSSSIRSHESRIAKSQSIKSSAHNSTELLVQLALDNLTLNSASEARAILVKKWALDLQRDVFFQLYPEFFTKFLKFAEFTIVEKGETALEQGQKLEYFHWIVEGQMNIVREIPLDRRDRSISADVQEIGDGFVFPSFEVLGTNKDYLAYDGHQNLQKQVYVDYYLEDRRAAYSIQSIERSILAKILKSEFFQIADQEIIFYLATKIPKVIDVSDKELQTERVEQQDWIKHKRSVFRELKLSMLDKLNGAS